MSNVTLNLLPTGVGFYDTGGLGAGGSKTTSVQTNDGDSSYMTFGAANRVETFTMDQLPSSAIRVVGNVTMTCVERAATVLGGGTVYKHRWRNGVTDADVDWSASLNVAYTADTDTRGTSPDTAAWTPANVNTMQCGTLTNAYGSGEARVTQIFSTVVVTLAAGGGPGFLIMEWLGPVLGAGLLLPDVAKIARALWTRSGGRVLVTDFADWHRELVEWTRPRYLFLGA